VKDVRSIKDRRVECKISQKYCLDLLRGAEVDDTEQISLIIQSLMGLIFFLTSC
jgi:hypothetical protein